jgi:phosphatidylserine/phosphatidylglycerophosphate/cardiolipin synthase-like enzyme
MEMDLLGTSLKAGQPLAMALAGVHPRKARKTRTVVDQLLQSMDKKTVGVALLAMSNAAKTATSEIEVVWSGPTPHGALGRTTWAVLDEVVQNAHEYIYAATYSAGHGAPAIKALRGALNRGLAVTCLVDVHNRPEAVAILKSELPGARLLGLSAQDNQNSPLMHAKFIVVDGHSTFLSSANFSNLAVEKSLEVGLLVQNSFVADQFKRRVEELLSSGMVEPI